MIKRDREIEIFTLSFLDIISCAFGAIIMILLVINKGDNNLKLEIETQILENNLLLISKIKQNIYDLKKNIEKYKMQVSNKRKNIEILNNNLEKEKKKLVEVSNAVIEKNNSIDALTLANKNLYEAKNKLLEMNKVDREVAGIPVDSDYVVFIVDTSGSMKSIWDKVIKELDNVLNIHPKVKGFQILNDNGIHLIDAYQNDWIPDTPSKRKSILKILKNWNSASNSSPVEGLKVALKKYTNNSISTSLYIFGDEFTGSSYTPVFDAISDLRSKNNVRISGVGFLSIGPTNDRFATLMREIAEKNRGTFLGLPIIGLDLR